MTSDFVPGGAGYDCSIFTAGSRGRAMCRGGSELEGGFARDGRNSGSLDELQIGQAIEGSRFAVTRVTIRLFCEASLDYNPLHLDDEFMQGRFGKTAFRAV